MFQIPETLGRNVNQINTIHPFTPNPVDNFSKPLVTLKAYADASSVVKLNNAKILTKFYTLNNVVMSGAKTECSGGFHNCTMVIRIKNTFNKMDHPQTTLESQPTILLQEALPTQKCERNAVKAGT